MAPCYQQRGVLATAMTKSTMQFQRHVKFSIDNSKKTHKIDIDDIFISKIIIFFQLKSLVSINKHSINSIFIYFQRHCVSSLSRYTELIQHIMRIIYGMTTPGEKVGDTNEHQHFTAESSI